MLPACGVHDRCIRRHGRPRTAAYLIPAAVACVLTTAAHAAPDAPVQGRKALLVVDAQAKDKTADEQLRALLQSRGLMVTLVDESEPARAADAARGQDLVLISSSTHADVIGKRFRELPVPVLTCQPDLLGDLGMTGPGQGEDFGLAEKKDHYLYVVNAADPLAGGLPPGAFVATAKSVKMNWGRPSLAAEVAVTPPGYFDTPVLFGYEKGATMAQGEPAPARRTSFFLGSEAFVQGRPTPAGLALFDAALRWTAGRAAVQPARPAAPDGKKMLLVVQRHSDHPKAEVREAIERSNAAMLEHFKALGFDVSVADQSDPPSMADGMDLVVISATVKASVLFGRYKDVNQPVVDFENDILDDMGMSAKRRGVDFGDVDDERVVTLINAPHPLAAGLPAGAIDLFQHGAGIGWGVPARGATTIATLHGAPDKAVIFAYDKGATMDHEIVAPARRVFLPVDYNAWSELTPQGVKLVDRALLWAMGG
jgi:hypothetical protein